MQRRKHLFTSVCGNFGLTINTDRAVAQRSTEYSADQRQQHSTDSCACLGNALPRCVKKKRRRSGSPDIQSQLGLRVLPNAVWSRHGLHLHEALLYGAEIWTVYTKQAPPSEIPKAEVAEEDTGNERFERHPQHPPPRHAEAIATAMERPSSEDRR
ncbi:hypothetical protein SprV_0301033400 [Sparganum proliferum]